MVYGDNYGNFHSHQFREDGFGKANKIAAKDKKASTVQFIDSNTLMIGGTGYLESFAYSAGKFSPLHAVTGAVRDFVWNPKHKILFVDQGMHGVTAYGYSDSGILKARKCSGVGCSKTDGGIRLRRVPRSVQPVIACCNGICHDICRRCVTNREPKDRMTRLQMETTLAGPADGHRYTQFV